MSADNTELQGSLPELDNAALVTPENVEEVVQASVPEALPVPRKLAGKFDTQEDLEKGYEHLQSDTSKKTSELAEVKNKLKEFDVPEDYEIAIEMGGDYANEVKALSKETGLSQKQFNRMIQTLVTRDENRVKEHARLIEEVKNDIGEENLSKLDVYTEQNFPPKMAEQLKKIYATDKESAKHMLAQRDVRLNRSLPTSGSQSVSAIDGKAKMKELAILLKDNPGNKVIEKQMTDIAFQMANIKR